MTKLSVLMPVYNERDTLQLIVDAVHAAPIKPIKVELIAVDDCSTDGTREQLQQLHDAGRQIEAAVEGVAGFTRFAAGA